MSNSYKAISLSAINAAGTSNKALYSALTTQMFFGQLSPLQIRINKGIVKPYFTVPLPTLESLNVSTKKALLLTACLQETTKKIQQLTTVMPTNTIEQIIIVTSMLSSNAEHGESIKTEWQQIALETVKEEFTQLKQLSEKVIFSYSYTPSLEQNLALCVQANGFKRPIIIINIESLCSYNDIKILNNKLDIQCHQGAAGIMPSEGATSTLFIPDNFPCNQINTKLHHLINIKSLNINTQEKKTDNKIPSIKEQLTHAKFSLPSNVLHVGTNSQTWATHWYGQTHSFYHQPNEPLTPPKTLTLYDQTNILGYLGIANFTTALASATALLTSPIENTSTVWIVEHSFNSKNLQPQANVYQITCTIN